MSKMIGFVAIAVLVFIIALSITYNQGIGISVANETGNLDTPGDPGAGGTIQSYETSTAWANALIALLVIGAIILGGYLLINIT